MTIYLATTHLGTASNQRTEVIALAIVVCSLIFELVRRKHLMERYAILWLLAGITVLVLGLWQGLLTRLSHAVGIYYPPSALFAVAFVFVLALLVHFSITISHLSDQSKVLAQKLALLEHEQQSASRLSDQSKALAQKLALLEHEQQSAQPDEAGEPATRDELLRTS